jgi:hypothetical protein
VELEVGKNNNLCLCSLSLPLLVLGVLANDANYAAAVNDLALVANLLD